MHHDARADGQVSASAVDRRRGGCVWMCQSRPLTGREERAQCGMMHELMDKWVQVRRVGLDVLLGCEVVVCGCKTVASWRMHACPVLNAPRPPLCICTPESGSSVQHDAQADGQVRRVYENLGGLSRRHCVCHPSGRSWVNCDPFGSFTPPKPANHSQAVRFQMGDKLLRETRKLSVQSVRTPVHALGLGTCAEVQSVSQSV